MRNITLNALLLASLFICSLGQSKSNNEDILYIGSEQCGSCHQDQYDKWLGSHHDLAMDIASRETVLGDFNSIEFTAHGVKSVFSKRDDKYYVHTDGPTGEMQEFLVKYTFGWHPLQQYLIEFPGGRLQSFGIAWDSRNKDDGGQRWFHLYPNEQDMGIDNPLHWTNRDQNWNYQCAACHSTNLRKNYQFDTDSYQTTWSEIDVGCEACHGPGHDHLKWANEARKGQNLITRNNGLSVDLAKSVNGTWITDKESGNPKLVKPRYNRKEIEICARCHSRRSAFYEENNREIPFLDAYMPTLLTEHLYHDDGQMKEEVYVYGSFIQSKMYQKGVTCSDCHEAHSLSLKAQGNLVCTRCHVEEKYDNKTHHFHSEQSDGALCAECHMPQTTFMLVDGRHDHSFRIPRPDLSLEIGTPNACNNCHKNKDPIWAVNYMNEWYGDDWTSGQHFSETFYETRIGKVSADRDLAAIALSNDLSDIVRATATSRLQEFPGEMAYIAAKYGANDSSPLVRISALQIIDSFPFELRLDLGLKLLNDSVRAVRIEAVRVLSPLFAEIQDSEQSASFESGLEEYTNAQLANADRPESHINLGLLSIRLKNITQAESHYRNALKIDPHFMPAYVNLADLYQLRRQEKEVIKILLIAKKIDPENADIRYALGLAYVRQKQLENALPELSSAYRLDPNNTRYGYVYAVAMDNVGKTKQAAKLLKNIVAKSSFEKDTIVALIGYLKKLEQHKEAVKYEKMLHSLDPNLTREY